MGSFLHTMVFFVIALAILIAFHEFGHFWVARRLGVKVTRFSIGFGKPLWRYRKSSDTTEFVVAAIPLGGYVKMVDEREGAVAPDDLPYAFNRQSLSVRSAVVLAGPLFNLMLAVLLYWLVLAVGETGLRPVLGPIDSNSLAAQAGLEEGEEIVAVEGRDTPTWALAMTTLFGRIMEGEEVEIEVLSADGLRQRRTLLVPADVANEPELLRERLGLQPWQPRLEPVIDAVHAGEAAALAGLRPGDRVLSVDGTAIETWRQWVETVRQHPAESLTVVVEREAVPVTLTLRPEKLVSDEGAIGRIGASVRVPQALIATMQVEYRLGIIPALGAALQKTYDYSLLTLKVIGRMIIGQASVENLSGPISIAQYAGQSASLGWMPFVKFLAIVSISLGVLNLLPIPVLDGGHLLFHLIEWVKGEPLSDQALALAQQLGFALLLALMGLAFFLDIERLLR